MVACHCTLVQDPDVSHANLYAYPGCRRLTCKTLCCKSLCRGIVWTMPTIPYACPGSQRFTRKILTRVQAPDHSNNCLWHGRLATSRTLPYASAGTQVLMLVHLPDNSKNCLRQGRLQHITHKSLLLYRFPIIHMQNPDACTGSQQFRPFLMPGQPPDNSKNSLHD
ncbi:hypothetical protein O181_032565 [Austropuccinia psidii MF-1]|uniref:Uncharacterized protein n=1 Tax=Austropuccinia psidii MF-1 TaxID=1389203 RepID=A0A9Q3H8C2_9BASI|nr:hypothetical protein [Austropuccinia psidii MF-1]